MAATSLMSDGVREWTVKIKTQVEGQTGPQSRQRTPYVDAQIPTPQSPNIASKAKPAAKFRILYLLGTPEPILKAPSPLEGSHHEPGLVLSKPMSHGFHGIFLPDPLPASHLRLTQDCTSELPLISNRAMD